TVACPHGVYVPPCERSGAPGQSRLPHHCSNWEGSMTGRSSNTNAPPTRALPPESLRNRVPGNASTPRRPDGRPPSSAPTMVQLDIPDLRDLRAMQLLAARFPDRSTHAVDLPYRLAWTSSRATGVVETALWREGDELVG